MISLLSKPNVRCVRTNCAGPSSSNQKFNLTNLFPLLNGDVAKKRNATLKDNINKMIAIGSNDLKECYDLAVELDVAHKKALKINKEGAAEDSSVQSDVIVSSEDENIFKGEQ